MSAPPKYCHAAECFLTRAARWVPNNELAEHLGILPRNVAVSLKTLIASGVLEREHREQIQSYVWRTKPQAAAPAHRFIVDWPPGFVSQFETVVVPSYKTWVK